jgi:hypothetical protein
MWIGMYVTGRFHDKYEVLCGLEQMIEHDAMIQFEVLCRLEQMWNNALMA